MADTDFVSGIVDNIMTNSNLSEIIEQIDAVQTENRELRELLHAQQKTINEMNIMLLKLFGQGLNQPVVPVVPAPVIAAAEVDAPEGNHETNEDAAPIQLEVSEPHSNMQNVD